MAEVISGARTTAGAYLKRDVWRGTRRNGRKATWQEIARAVLRARRVKSGAAR